jgi:hypothetical protein
VVLRYGEQRIATACLIGVALAARATFLAPLLWLIYPIMRFRTMASSSTVSSLGALTTNRVSPRAECVDRGNRRCGKLDERARPVTSWRDV